MITMSAFGTNDRGACVIKLVYLRISRIVRCSVRRNDEQNALNHAILSNIADLWSLTTRKRQFDGI